MTSTSMTSAAAAPRLIVVTGGPGAGKTAVLEVARRHLCPHVVVLPEAASIIFRGGFPRTDALPDLCAAQRTIYHVQRELERAAIEKGTYDFILCDRGTIDGLAYWPDVGVDLMSEVGSSFEAELARYTAVIHMRTPAFTQGYDHSNPTRVEDPATAAALDDKLLAIWQQHPKVLVIDATDGFLDKLVQALAAIHSLLGTCARCKG